MSESTHPPKEPAQGQFHPDLPTADALSPREQARGSAGTRLVEGDRLGPYTIIRSLGDGGFGVVYLAEQFQPLRRHVAVKVLRPGMDSEEIIARFEAERQALAMMNHPGIAKIFDAGLTPSGRPYFAMEYVEGEAISAYCERARLDVESRLRLVASVCRAVQHAHQKGVIHRDLKPSNILVSTADEGPAPKVIDFGIAKVTAALAGDRTLHTEAGRIFGTPEYMSPEQARSGGADVDTRTDVYSLGVVLYELLTGGLPYHAGSVRTGGSDALVRLIADTNPPKPSTRVATATADPRTTHTSAIAPDARSRNALRRRLRGEIDWIVMRALEKDRARRYESPGALADDIERHLKGEPVLAGPPSLSYRTRKFVGRHRVGVGVAGAFVALIAGGVVGLAVLYARAESQRRIAQRESARAAGTLQFVEEMFATVDPVNAKGREITVREMLDSAAARADITEWPEPGVEWGVRDVMARAYHALGEIDPALHNAGRVLELRRETLGEDDPLTLNAAHNHAATLIAVGRLDDAKETLARAVDARRRVLGPESPDTLASESLWVAVLQRQGKFDEAEPIIRRVVQTQTKVLGVADRATIDSRLSLVDILDQLARYEEAQREAEALIRDADRALGPDDPFTQTSRSILASILQNLGKLDEAEAIDRAVLESRTRVMGPEHPETLLTMDQLAQTLRRAGKTDEAVTIVAAALETCVRKLGPDHPTTLTTRHNYADTLAAARRFEESQTEFETVIAASERIHGPGAVATLRSVNQLGMMLVGAGRAEEALPKLTRVLEGLSAALPPDHWMLPMSRICVGECLVALRRGPEAEATFRAAFESIRAAQGATSPSARRAAEGLAQALELQGRADEAAEWNAIAAGG